MTHAHLHRGKAEECMKRICDASVDLVLADPPYDIAVDGVAWDKVTDYMGFARVWLSECVRVMRPGSALLLYGSPCRTWVARMTVLLVDELGLRYVQDMPWVYTQGGDARITNMKEYAVRHEQLVWFEKPPTIDQTRTFNALSAWRFSFQFCRAIDDSVNVGRCGTDARGIAVT